jgi:hypothetical protein
VKTTCPECGGYRKLRPLQSELESELAENTFPALLDYFRIARNPPRTRTIAIPVAAGLLAELEIWHQLSWRGGINFNFQFVDQPMSPNPCCLSVDTGHQSLGHFAVLHILFAECFDQCHLLDVDAIDQRRRGKHQDYRQAGPVALVDPDCR